jgi:hypothetical protein
MITGIPTNTIKRILKNNIVFWGAMLLLSALAGCAKDDAVSVVNPQKETNRTIAAYEDFLLGKTKARVHDAIFVRYPDDKNNISINDILNQQDADGLLEYVLFDALHEYGSSLFLRKGANLWMLSFDKEELQIRYVRDAKFIRLLNNGDVWEIRSEKHGTEYNYLNFIGEFYVETQFVKRPPPEGDYFYGNDSVSEEAWSSLMVPYMALVNEPDRIKWCPYADFRGHLQGNNRERSDENATVPSLGRVDSGSAEDTLPEVFQEFLAGERVAVNALSLRGKLGFWHPALSYKPSISIGDVLLHPEVEYDKLEYTVVGSDTDPFLYLRANDLFKDFFFVLAPADGELNVRYLAEKSELGSKEISISFPDTCDILEEEVGDGIVSYTCIWFNHEGYAAVERSLRKCDTDGDGEYTEADLYWYDGVKVTKDIWDNLTWEDFGYGDFIVHVEWHRYADFDERI